MREIMLIFHFIGLVMGMGTGFAHAFLGAAAGKMSPEERVKFSVNTLALGPMGLIGISLLLISGFYMITPYWKVLSDMPWLMAKLSLVGVLILLIVIINIASAKLKKGDISQLKKLKVLGMGTLLVALSIIVCAVKTFH